MDDLERRTTEMLLRVNNFGTENAAAVGVFAKAVAAFAQIQTGISELEAKGVLRSSAGETKLSLTSRRKMMRNELYNDMTLIASNARQIARDNADFVNKFRVPKMDKSDLAWIEAARQFAQDLPAVKEMFLELAMNDDFIEDLIADTDDFEEAIGGQDTSNRQRIGANVDIDDILGTMLKAVRTLKIMMPNIFHGNPGKLAEWAAASHIEKAPKGTPRNPPPTP